MGKRVPLSRGDDGSHLQDISYTTLITFCLDSFQLNYSMLSKGLKGNFNSIGLTLGLYSLFGSIGVILVDKLGGDLFSTSKVLPFYITSGTYAFMIFIIIILALCKQLQI